MASFEVFFFNDGTKATMAAPLTLAALKERFRDVPSPLVLCQEKRILFSDSDSFSEKTDEAIFVFNMDTLSEPRFPKWSAITKDIQVPDQASKEALLKIWVDVNNFYLSNRSLVDRIQLEEKKLYLKGFNQLIAFLARDAARSRGSQLLCEEVMVHPALSLSANGVNLSSFMNLPKSQTPEGKASNLSEKFSSLLEGLSDHVDSERPPSDLLDEYEKNEGHLKDLGLPDLRKLVSRQVEIYSILKAKTLSCLQRREKMTEWLSAKLTLCASFRNELKRIHQCEHYLRVYGFCLAEKYFLERHLKNLEKVKETAMETFKVISHALESRFKEVQKLYQHFPGLSKTNGIPKPQVSLNYPSHPQFPPIEEKDILDYCALLQSKKMGTLVDQLQDFFKVIQRSEISFQKSLYPKEIKLEIQHLNEEVELLKQQLKVSRGDAERSQRIKDLEQNLQRTFEEMRRAQKKVLDRENEIKTLKQQVRDSSQVSRGLDPALDESYSDAGFSVLTTKESAQALFEKNAALELGLAELQRNFTAQKAQLEAQQEEKKEKDKKISELQLIINTLKEEHAQEKKKMLEEKEKEKMLEEKEKAKMLEEKEKVKMLEEKEQALLQAIEEKRQEMARMIEEKDRRIAKIEEEKAQENQGFKEKDEKIERLRAQLQAQQRRVEEAEERARKAEEAQEEERKKKDTTIQSLNSSLLQVKGESSLFEAEINQLKGRVSLLSSQSQDLLQLEKRFKVQEGQLEEKQKTIERLGEELGGERKKREEMERSLNDVLDSLRRLETDRIDAAFQLQGLHDQKERTERILDECNAFSTQAIETVAKLYQKTVSIGISFSNLSSIPLPTSITHFEDFDPRLLDGLRIGELTSFMENQRDLFLSALIYIQASVSVFLENKKVSLRVPKEGDLSLFMKRGRQWFALHADPNGPEYQLDEESKEALEASDQVFLKEFAICEVIAISCVDHHLNSFSVIASPVQRSLFA